MIHVLTKAALKIIFFLKEIFLLNKVGENAISIGKLPSLYALRFFPKTNFIAPFALGRTIRGLSFSKNLMKDPFGRVCSDLVHKKSIDGFAENLYEAYLHEKGTSVSDLLGLPNDNNRENFPSWSLVLPWDELSLEEKQKNYSNAFITNRSSNGHNFSSGELFYSLEGAESQAHQTYKLYESIVLNGIKTSNKWPRINILIDGDKWVWMMSGEGNHRAYLFYLFGEEKIYSQIDQVVKKQDSSKWPNVINNTYSREEAELIFDRAFNGSSPVRGIV